MPTDSNPEVEFWKEYEKNQERLLRPTRKLLYAWDAEYDRLRDRTAFPPPSDRTFAQLQYNVEEHSEDLLHIKRYMARKDYRLSDAQMEEMVLSLAIAVQRQNLHAMGVASASAARHTHPSDPCPPHPPEQQSSRDSTLPSPNPHQEAAQPASDPPSRRKSILKWHQPVLKSDQARPLE